MRSIQRAQVLVSRLAARPTLYHSQVYIPAPKTTLDNPFHNDRKPSTLETVTRALAMELVYVAAGPGFMTCILVCPHVSAMSKATSQTPWRWHTLSISTGYITECS
jgi:hypothetical protein